MKLPNLTKRQLSILAGVGWLLVFGMMILENISSGTANDIAKQELVLAQRPYVVIEPVRFPDTGHYISLTEESDELRLRVLFKFTNTGNSIAKNVKTSDIVWTIGISQAKATLERIPPPNQIKCLPTTGQNDLAPGDFTHFSLNIEFPKVQKEILLNTLKNFENDQFSFPVNLEVYYESDLLEKPVKTAFSIIMKKNEIVKNYNVAQ